MDRVLEGGYKVENSSNRWNETPGVQQDRQRGAGAVPGMVCINAKNSIHMHNMRIIPFLAQADFPMQQAELC